MSASIHAFAESENEAHRLADALGIGCFPIDMHRFPDGESLVRVVDTAPTAILYRSLDEPNTKLVEIMLAASALRDGGAANIILVAPYMAYMRQDIAFRPGEAVSQKVIGGFIAAHFDALVTVDPHLHRTHSLDEIVPGRRTVNVSAASTLAAMLRSDVASDTLLVGPDIESRPWVESVAGTLNLEVMVGSKARKGDRSVELTLPDVDRVRGRPAILVDDMISSGETLLVCARQLHAAGATTVEAVAVHCLARSNDVARLLADGITRVRSTDTIPGPTSVAAIATAIANAMRQAMPEWIDQTD